MDDILATLGGEVEMGKKLIKKEKKKKKVDREEIEVKRLVKK